LQVKRDVGWTPSARKEEKEMNKFEFYSLINVLTERGGNVLDCFYPLILSSLDPEKYYSVEDISDSLNKHYSVKFPIHFIKALITYGVGKGDFYHENTEIFWPIRLTNKGRDKYDSFENIDDISRNISQLMTYFKQSFESEGINLSIDQITEIVNKFIEDNLEVFLGYIYDKGTDIENLAKNHEYVIIVKYIYKIEEENASLFKILNDLVLGAEIASILKYDENEYTSITKEDGQKRVKIYCDANFLFSLLELHSKEYSDSALELYNLMMQNRYELYVYDLTIQEMVHVLKSYLVESNIYPKSVKVNTLYGSLKQKGYDHNKTLILISSLVKKLEEKKIALKTTGYVLETYDEFDTSLEEKIISYKPRQKDIYRKHDLFLLTKATHLRRSACFDYCECDSFILTSDYKLSKINYIEMNHKSNSSIGEIILDRVFTNILFLRNPSLSVSVKSIISAYSRELFIKKSIWEKFYSTMLEVKKENNISDEKLAHLFYDHFIESELAGYSEGQEEEIDEEYVMELIEDANQRFQVIQRNSEEAQKKNIQENDLVHRKEIESLLDEKEKEKEKELNDTMEKITNRIGNSAKKKATRYSCYFRIFVGITLLIPMAIAILTNIKSSSKIDVLSPYNMIAAILMIFDIVGMNVAKIWDRLDNKLFEKINKSMLEDIIDDSKL
jgi:predicted nucleic acid-binding protein